jgi:hypothetical protein
MPDTRPTDHVVMRTTCEHIFKHDNMSIFQYAHENIPCVTHAIVSTDHVVMRTTCEHIFKHDNMSIFQYAHENIPCVTHAIVHCTSLFHP